MDGQHADEEIMWASGKLESGAQCCSDSCCHAELRYPCVPAMVQLAAVREEADQPQCSLLMKHGA